MRQGWFKRFGSRLRPRLFEWIGAALVGVLIMMVLTEGYNWWQSEEERKNIERHLREEIITNLDLIYEKIELLHPLDYVPRTKFTENGELTRFWEIVNISFYRDVFFLHAGHLQKISYGSTVRTLYAKLDNLERLQEIQTKSLPRPGGFDVFIDKDLKFRFGIIILKDYSSLVFAYGCAHFAALELNCHDRLLLLDERVQFAEKLPGPLSSLGSEDILQALEFRDRFIDRVE